MQELILAIALLLMLVTCAPPSLAQTHFFNPTLLPTERAKPEDFLPRGWEIKHAEGQPLDEYGQLARGDLNQDGREDVALIMTNFKDDYQPFLLVLLQTEKGTFRRDSYNNSLVLAPSYDTNGVTEYPSVEIKKGVLILRQSLVSSGLEDIEQYVHRFRYDPVSRRFLLIGADSEYDSRSGSRNGLRISDNYLTGERIITKKIVGRRGGARGDYEKTVDQRSRIERKRVFMEETEVDDKTLSRLTGR